MCTVITCIYIYAPAFIQPEPITVDPAHTRAAAGPGQELPTNEPPRDSRWDLFSIEINRVP